MPSLGLAAWLLLGSVWAWAQPAFTEVSGPITEDTQWGPALGEIRVIANVEIRAEAVLTLLPGAEVRLAPEVSVVAWDGSGLELLGDPGAPVRLSPLEGTNVWATVGARGTNSWVRLRHAALEGGQCSAFAGARATLEDSSLSDFRRFANATLLNHPILVTEGAAEVRVERCRFRNYHEVLLRYTRAEISDCLFEVIHGDGLDFDYGQPGTLVRDSTFRHGQGVNIDALDVGSQSRGVTVERCLMYDFPFDKGVSIGEQSTDIVVRDCVIHHVQSGVAVKDSSEAELVHNTITASDYGFRFYEKYAGQGGGHAEAWDNVLWGNTQAVELDELSTLLLTWSDVQGGYPGEGNLDSDPGFRDSSQDDVRLAQDSPARGQGREGADMGARFPVGSSLVDTDTDGMPDPWEQQFDLVPTDPEDAVGDADGDGMLNRDEYRAGTDPQEDGSRLALQVDRDGPGGVRLAFDPVPGRAYVLEIRSDLASGEWVGGPRITEVPAVGRWEWVDPVADAGRYYRLAVTGW